MPHPESEIWLTVVDGTPQLSQPQPQTGELPRFTAPDLTEEILENLKRGTPPSNGLRITDVRLTGEKAMLEKVEEISKLWEGCRDALISFRSGTAGMRQEARVVGFTPCYLQDESGTIYYYFRLFLALDDQLLGESGPPAPV